jgi:hypothetical protein
VVVVMVVVVVMAAVMPVMVMVVGGDLQFFGFGGFWIRRERCIVCSQQF